MENTRREELSRIAAVRLLFGERTPGYSPLESSLHSSTDLEYNRSTCCCGLCDCTHLNTMGAARRTFCLVVAFDMILSFILWGLHVVILGKETLAMDFIVEVAKYHIRTSLFDIFICAVVRFLLLTIAYALCNLRNPSVIAITTFFTCVLVIAKVFSFGFDKDPLPYIILVQQFLIAWIETWILDFKVLPLELASDAYLSGSGLTPGGTAVAAGDSPFHTPQEGSPDGPSSPLPELSSYEDTRMRSVAVDNWRRACGIINIKDGWKQEPSTSDSIYVYSQQIEKLGKVLKIEARIEGSPEDVYRVTSVEYEQSPQWNKTVLECRVLQVLDADTDVTYNVVAKAGGGAVSSRDFVTVRHSRQLDDPGRTRLSAACAVKHPHKPPDERFVRGENRLSAFMYRAVPGAPCSCNLIMFVSTDIKGWIPQVVVDKALSGVLVDFVRCLRQKMRESTSYQGVNLCV